MTITLGGNGLTPFDEIEESGNVASVEVDIRDDDSQNICLVMGTVGSNSDNVFGRVQLLDSGGTVISNIKGRSASVGITTSTGAWSSDLISTNVYGVGNSSSDSSISGERMQLMVWIQAAQNASQPFYDVTMHIFSNFTYTSGAFYSGRSGAYYQGAANPRTLKFFFSSGDISNANLKSFIIGTD